MKRTKPVSVKGLANIGALVARGGHLSSAAPDDAPKGDSLAQIVEKTLGKLESTSGHRLGPAVAADANNRRVLDAAVRDAHKLGQVEAVKQSDLVEQMLNEQYTGRVSALLPAVAAVIMEQLGMTDMTLDLDAVETVFERVTIDYQLNHGGPAGNFITYKLDHLSDRVPA